MYIKNLALAAAFASTAGIAQATTINVSSTAAGTSVIGSVSSQDTSSFSAGNISGTATIVFNGVNGGGSPFSASFLFLVDNSPVLNTQYTTDQTGVTLGSVDVGGGLLTGEITGEDGTTNYDISINIAAVPLPAAGFLMLGGLAGLGAMRRRKK